MPNPIRLNKKALILILIFILALSYFYFQFGKKLRDSYLESARRKKAWGYLEKDILKATNNFKGNAGIVIKDLKRGREINLNQDKAFPSASLVKLPIMAACFYANSEGKINIKQALFLKNEHKVLGSGRLKELPSGTAMNIRYLIEMMVAESDNTATNMLIDLLGYDYLNTAFKKAGLNNTDIVRRMMDFKGRKNGKENFTTARDMAIILSKIYYGQLLNKLVSEECLGILKRQKMRDRIPAKLPLNTTVAHKTGLEKRVCHDAGIVFTPQGDFLICVLVKHRDKTSKAAKEFISEVALTVYNYMVKD